MYKRQEKGELHYEIERDEYLHKTVINDKITDLMLSKNTYGDWTKINNSDRFDDIIKGKMNDIEVMVYNNNNNKLDVNKNDLCYKYVRYIHDDGGWIKRLGKEQFKYCLLYTSRCV